MSFGFTTHVGLALQQATASTAAGPYAAGVLGCSRRHSVPLPVLAAVFKNSVLLHIT